MGDLLTASTRWGGGVGKREKKMVCGYIIGSNGNMLFYFPQEKQSKNWLKGGMIILSKSCRQPLPLAKTVFNNMQSTLHCHSFFDPSVCVVIIILVHVCNTN